MISHICFVCSGDTCRSPMAASVFRAHLREAGLAHIRVTGAGIGARHEGEPADSGARAVPAAHGYDTEHTACEIGAEHLDADLFVAVGAEHVACLHEKIAEDRVRLLRSFDPSAPPGAGLADPYSGTPQDYEHVLATIEHSMPGRLAEIRP